MSTSPRHSTAAWDYLVIADTFLPWIKDNLYSQKSWGNSQVIRASMMLQYNEKILSSVTVIPTWWLDFIIGENNTVIKFYVWLIKLNTKPFSYLLLCWLYLEQLNLVSTSCSRKNEEESWQKHLISTAWMKLIWFKGQHSQHHGAP